MNSTQWKEAADLVIEPDVNGYKYDAFEHSAELIRAGELVTMAALPEIRRALERERPYVPERRRPPVTRPVTAPAE
jgi:hypothetical protein